MTYLIKILRRIKRRAERVRSGYYLRRFLLAAKRRHKHLEIEAFVRFNVPVRGDGAGTLVIGKHNSFGFRPCIRLGSGAILIQARHPNAEIFIGEGNAFSNNISIVANERITIGDRCRIGDMVAIWDCDFHELQPETRNRSHGATAPVHIGNNVWLGSRAIVMKGVTIGDNSVIAAMSVVTKSIPPNCIAAGFPARVVRSLSCGQDSES